MPRATLGHRSANRTLQVQQLRTLTGGELPTGTPGVALVESVRRHGILVPILVTHFTEDGEEAFRVIDGRRRVMALQTVSPGVGIPCRVLTGVTPAEIAEILLTANLQRSANYRAEVQAYLSRDAERAFSESPTPRDPLTLLPALRHRRDLADLPDIARRLFLSGAITHALASRLARATTEVRVRWDEIVRARPGTLSPGAYAEALNMAEQEVAARQPTLFPETGVLSPGAAQPVSLGQGRFTFEHAAQALRRRADQATQRYATLPAMGRNDRHIAMPVPAPEAAVATLELSPAAPAMSGVTERDILLSLMALMDCVASDDLNQSDAITRLLHTAFTGIARLVGLDPNMLEA